MMGAFVTVAMGDCISLPVKLLLRTTSGCAANRVRDVFWSAETQPEECDRPEGGDARPWLNLLQCNSDKRTATTPNLSACQSG
jgi:hypothetical protein